MKKTTKTTVSARQRTASPLCLAGSDRQGSPEHGLLFAVYAPFGGDPALSSFPGDRTRPIAQQALLGHLRNVAAQGVNVAALIDLFDDDTWLVEIPAFRPNDALVVSAWKQAMNRPQALAGFLRRAHQRFPCSDLVLALEGHGAGFLPEVAQHRITPQSTGEDTEHGSAVQWNIGPTQNAPVDPDTGLPILGQTAYENLPVDSPEALPVTLPLSTWAVAQALAMARKAGVPKPAVVHFDNCFNMSLEHLHTLAPHAEVATGYANYNYFTAGMAYPPLFERLRLHGPVTAEVFGRWFAEANHAPLAAKGFHPGVGASLPLKRVRKVAEALEAMARALTAALRADRATHHPRIRQGIIDALQYDSNGDFHLDVPDQQTDLGTWAEQLQAAYPTGDVHDAAAALQAALKGAQVYGDADSPHMDTTQHWDFSDAAVAMNILLPDPDCRGLSDWRTPYYMLGTVDPTRAPALKAQIPLLADRAGTRAPWPEFLVEYHKDTPFVGLLRIPPFVFPRFEHKFEPPTPGTTGQPGTVG